MKPLSEKLVSAHDLIELGLYPDRLFYFKEDVAEAVRELNEKI